MIRKGFLEDGVVQAETYRLSGSEPKPEIEQALPAEGTPYVKARSLSKDLATLRREESREAGREEISALNARLRGLPSNPRPWMWENRGRVFSRVAARSGVSMLGGWSAVPPAARQACCGSPRQMRCSRLAGWESEIAHTCSALGEVTPPSSVHFICIPVKDSSVLASWVTFSLRLLIHLPLGLQAELGECMWGVGRVTDRDPPCGGDSEGLANDACAPEHCPAR